MKLQKKAMAMIMAIMVIVIIGTIMALSLNMTTLTTSRNLDMYFNEQMEILSDSAREYALYKIANTPCIYSGSNIVDQDSFYDINISVKYVTKDGCTATPSLNFTNDTDADLLRATAIIDITMSLDKAQTNTSEDVRFYKRYIENIKP